MLSSLTKYVLKSKIFIVLSFIALPLMAALCLMMRYSAAPSTVLASSTALNTLNSGSVKIPILMYHKLTKNSSLLGKWVITPDEFESDLKYLSENGYEAVTMKDLTEYVHNGVSLPEKPVVLTFDDGDSSVHRYALPILKKYEMKAVVSIIGKPTDDYSDKAEGIYYPHLTWLQVKDLHDSGFVEIQNHSYDMHGKKKGVNGALKYSGESNDEYKERLIADLSILQNKIKEAIGTEPNTFVYPFGAISSQSVDILRDMGFKASLSCNSIISEIVSGQPDSLYRLGRMLRPHGGDISKSLKKLEKENETAPVPLL